MVGPSADTVLRADQLQRHGFYALPVRPPTVPEGTSRIRFSLTADVRAVRPPTVPEGTSRIRFSLTADVRADEILRLIACIPEKS